MERRISLEPRTFMLIGVALLIVIVLNILLPDPPIILWVAVIIIIAFLVVFQRYFSDIKLENTRVHLVSEITFYAALVAILGAYAIFIVTGSAIGEFLYALSIILFCCYIILPGLNEKFAKNRRTDPTS
ncbi:MAG: hypothetical protein ACFFDT_14575 [Candidatus Hodarchaeota archaeon]